MMRRAILRTPVPDPQIVADAIRPDNTNEMVTTVRDGAVETTIERESTSGLRSTIDDYVVNLAVAVDVAQHAKRHGRSERNDERHDERRNQDI